MKDWQSFRVAIQLTKDGPLHVFTVKENDQEKVAPFVCRMYELKSLKEAAYAEIHKLTRPGVIEVIYGDLNAEWPATKTIWHSGYRVSGKNGRMLAVGGSEEQDPIASSVRVKQAQAAADANTADRRTPVAPASVIEYHHGERFVIHKVHLKVA